MPHYRKGGGRPKAIWIVRRAPRPGQPHHGLLIAGGIAHPCRLGRSGATVRKREGDGATPAGTLRVVGGYRRGTPSGLAGGGWLWPIEDSLGWCDAPRYAAYNRPVQLPIRFSAESMFREDRLYDVCLVLDWNLAPRSRNRGSAIFLHQTRPDGGATEGCIALAPGLMRRLLPRLAGRRLRVEP